MTKKTSWIIFAVFCLLLVAIVGAAVWIAYQELDTILPAPLLSGESASSAAAPASPQRPSARHPAYAGDRYYAGMPQPARDFSGDISVLDNTGYSVGYCRARKAAVWAAYRAFRVGDLKAPPRPKHFDPDPRIPGSPVSGDYTNSGYDRGHLAPNYIIAICYGTRAQAETFQMTNVLPEKPELNREVWEHLEEQEARVYAQRYGTLWVMVGPVFDDAIEKLRGGEEIPDKLWKVMVREDGGHPEVLAFMVPQNVTGHEPVSQFLTSVAEIQRETRLDFLRDLPDDEEAKVEAGTAAGMW